MNYRFTLEPYKGVSTRHICPNCHRKSCFAKYIDTEKQICFPDYVGRCNHEQTCGYNYTPKMYFDENLMAKERLSEEFVPVSKPRISLPPEPSFIEPEIMRQSLKLYYTNKLFQFLSFHFGQETTEELMLRYHVGTSKHWPGATVFWQVDISGRVRTGKVMLYNPESGRRIKEPHNDITWVHSLLKKENFNLRQCLFGEHLLSYDQQRPVALVESEKSALISSFYLPQYLRIASGGKNGAFNRDAVSVLRNRRVLFFPDLGATDYWNSKMEMIRSLEIEASLFDFMERNATKEERDAGYDIADFLLREETKVAIFNRLIALNPAVKRWPKLSICSLSIWRKHLFQQRFNIPGKDFSNDDCQMSDSLLFHWSKFMPVYYIFRPLAHLKRR